MGQLNPQPQKESCEPTDKDEEGKHTADFLCARHHSELWAYILSPNPPSNPMTHVPSFISFYPLRVQNDRTAEKQEQESRSKSGCPIPQPKALVHQAILHPLPFFIVISLFRPTPQNPQTTM